MDYLKRIKQLHCTACLGGPSEPHHITSRGAGGKDTEWNLMPLCRKCHRLYHDKGGVYMADKYYYVYAWLIINGWKLVEFPKKKWIQVKYD